MPQFDAVKQLDAIKEYTKSICEQVRWKKAHQTISQELENHITDQKDAFIAEGFSETEATGKAVEQMGDPITVGSQFDRTYRPKTAWSMIGLTILALFIGVLIQFLIQGSSPRDIPASFYFQMTILYAVIGIVCMSVAYFLDFTIIGKYPKVIFIGLSALLLLFPLLGIEMNGAKIWLPLLGTPFRVSLPILLSLFPAVYAGIIYCTRSKGYAGILLCGLFYAVPAMISLSVRGSLSGVLIYTLICFILLLFSITRGWFSVRRLYGILLVVLPTITVLAAMLFSSQYIMARLGAALSAWIFPWTDNYGTSYIEAAIRTMLDGAKFWGEGTLPGELDAARWLPGVHADYLVTYLIHRFGWVSFLVITTVLAAFILRGFYLCAKQKNVLGRLIATAILLTLSVQIIIYLLANLGFQIFSQMTLPLISYGGSAMVVNLTLIGIMLSVFKTGDIADGSLRSAQSDGNGNKLFSIEDGKIIIDLGLK